MCEVLRENFEDVIPRIESCLKECVFYAIDSEFTGLSASDAIKPSLFDTPAARYRKLQKTASQFLISQFGLSIFVAQKENINHYTEHTFNFYLFPVPFGPIDVRFSCQASSLEFLCHHGFDFNKFIYCGIPYLNTEQEAKLRYAFKQRKLHLQCPPSLARQIDREVLIGYRESVEDWLTNNKDDRIELQSSAGILQLLIIREIRGHYPELNIQTLPGGKIVVYRSPSISAVDEEQEIEIMLQSARGFSRVFQLMVESKKPLVGHNILTDLLLMYEKFYKTLPDRYEDFKSIFNKLFPAVYDTKQLSAIFNKIPKIRETGFMSEMPLGHLHKKLTSNESLYYVLFSPYIKHAEGFQSYEGKGRAHEAGYDAYMAGTVFLRLAHLAVGLTGSRPLSTPVRFYTYQTQVKPHVNHINLSRASVRYVNLGGRDPPPVHKDWYIVMTLTSEPINAEEVMSEFSMFGAVDVKILDKTTALVVVTYTRRKKEIFRKFRGHKRLAVRRYSVLDRLGLGVKSSSALLLLTSCTVGLLVYHLTR